MPMAPVTPAKSNHALLDSIINDSGHKDSHVETHNLRRSCAFYRRSSIERYIISGIAN